MSKRSVAFTKPSEPAFLTRLKQQVGFKEGPNVDTKREALPQCTSDDSDGEDKPVVVVLKPGDLTEEEAEKVKKESEEAPADLEKRVLFKKPEKRPPPETNGGDSTVEKKKKKPDAVKKTERRGSDKKDGGQPRVTLSFSDGEEEEG